MLWNIVKPVLLSLFILICNAPFLSVIYADVTPDGTLGTTVVTTDPIYDYIIKDGKPEGSNLFHSFSKFSIIKGDMAKFTGAGSVDNIIARVTGGAPSDIDGLLQSEIPGASLYFINPSGVMIGPNAMIDIKGSFHASTADYLILGKSGRFYASIEESSSITSAPPTAFGFLGSHPAKITVEGFINSAEDESISLTGGDIDITGGMLFSKSGEIQIVSVASSGEVILTDKGADVSSFTELGDIVISDGAMVDVSDLDGASGDIFIRGEDMTVKDYGSMITSITGEKDGGGIDIQLSGDLEVYDQGVISTLTVGTGDGGDIVLDADNLVIKDGFEISTISGVDAVGRAGDIHVTARNAVTVSGNETFPGRLDTSTKGNGDGGDIDIKADRLEVTDNGVITSGSLGDGRGGDIAIDVNRLEIDRGYISSSVRGSGDGGDITINAKEAVNVSGSGKDDSGLLGEYYGIYAQTLGTGDGGHITIDTLTMTITKDGMVNGQTYNSGRGGDVTLGVETLDLTEGGTVTVSTRGAGRAGDIEIDASKSVNVSGYGAKLENSWFYSATHSAGHGGNITVRTPDLILDQNGAIFANTLGDDTHDGNTLGDGDAGNIKLETERIVLDNGGAVLAGSESDGRGGNIDITAVDSIHISNLSHGGPNAAGVESSGVYARAQGSGRGGHIAIRTHTMGMTEHGAISTSASNAGHAGDIDLNLQRLIMHSGSAVTSESGGSGAAGSIDINAVQEVRLKRSTISTEASWLADGGTIAIDTPALEMTDKSQVSASVPGGAGKGGSIDIRTDTLDVNKGSRIETSTGGAGTGGVITIDASEAVNLTGRPSESTSGLFSISTGSGNAGQIKAAAPLLMLNGNTTISTSGSGAGKGGDIDLSVDRLGMVQGASIAAKSTGSGDAGSITVHASDKIQMENSTITTEALNADGGNINLHPGYMLYLIDSVISAAVSGGLGDGGNITVAKPKFVILNASDIIADAHGGKGGNIDIQADYFLGSAESVLDASSALGVDGVVNVDASFTGCLCRYDAHLK